MSRQAATRRQFIAGSLAASVLTTWRHESVAQDGRKERPYQLFWGDLHNHNAVGYGKGSLERSIEIARSHLDFFAFTGHASWHDMPQMPGGRQMKWINGFKTHADHWPKTRRPIRQANSEDFVASSDDHRGYPGASGEGVTGIWARDLSAEAVFEALRSRRTHAATGDRVTLDVALKLLLDDGPF